MTDCPPPASSFTHDREFTVHSMPSHLLTNSTAMESDVVRARLGALFALAIGDSHGGRGESCELVTDIWTVNLPALVQRRMGLTELQERLERSVSAVDLTMADQRLRNEGVRPT